MAEHPTTSTDSIDQPRRLFLKTAVFAFSGAIALLMAWPLTVALIAPAYRRPRRSFFNAGKLDRIPIGQPQRITFPYTTIEGFIRQSETRDAWVVRHSDTDLTVFSPICTHLSCRYDWSPQANRFVCPCHGSVFSPDGKVLAGPSPRPLDTLPFKIENGELFIQWEIFKSGIPEKVPV